MVYGMGLCVRGEYFNLPLLVLPQVTGRDDVVKGSCRKVEFRVSKMPALHS